MTQNNNQARAHRSASPPPKPPPPGETGDDSLSDETVTQSCETQPLPCAADQASNLADRGEAPAEALFPDHATAQDEIHALDGETEIEELDASDLEAIEEAYDDPVAEEQIPDADELPTQPLAEPELKIESQALDEHRMLGDEPSGSMSENDFSRPIPLIDNEIWARQSVAPLRDLRKTVKRVVRNAVLGAAALFLLMLGSYFGLFELYKQQRTRTGQTASRPTGGDGLAVSNPVGDAAYFYPVQKAIDLLKPRFEERLREQEQEDAVSDETSIASVTPSKSEPASENPATKYGWAEETAPKAPSAEGKGNAEAAGRSRAAEVKPGSAVSRPAVTSRLSEPAENPAASAKNNQKNKIQRTMQSLQKKASRSCAIYGTGKVGVRITVYETGMAKSIRVYGQDAKGLLGKCATQIAKTMRYPKSPSEYDIERTIIVK